MKKIIILVAGVIFLTACNTLITVQETRKVKSLDKQEIIYGNVSYVKGKEYCYYPESNDPLDYDNFDWCLEFSYIYEYDRQGNLTRAFSTMDFDPPQYDPAKAAELYLKSKELCLEIIYAYSQKGNRVMAVLKRGLEAPSTMYYENHYDRKGNLVKVIFKDDTGKTTTVVENLWNSRGYLIKETVKDSTGQIQYVCKSLYDWHRNLIKENKTEKSAKNYKSIRKFKYTATGKRVQETVFTIYGKHTNYYEYDKNGNLIKFVDNTYGSPATQEYEYTFDSLGNYTRRIVKHPSALSKNILYYEMTEREITYFE